MDQRGRDALFAAAGLGWASAPTLAYEDSKIELRSTELAAIPERTVIGPASREDETDPSILGLVDDIKTAFASPGRAPVQCYKAGEVDVKAAAIMAVLSARRAPSGCGD